MAYFMEVWLRGFAKDRLRTESRNDEFCHPHITFVRPFYITTDEDEIKNKIITFCKDKDPISFSLEGKASFEGVIHYVPVVDGDALLQFNDDLEELLKDDVTFAKKLNARKILHATVNGDLPYCPRIDQYMFRLTGIKDKRIWFSYDFITKRALDREKSLDKGKWHQTVQQFTRDYGLIPTPDGFRKVDES